MCFIVIELFTVTLPKLALVHFIGIDL